MFECIRPNTLQELLEEIDKKDYYIFAGGTDLMIRKRQWQGAERKFDKDIAFISQLNELKGISEKTKAYQIMSCVTQSEMANSEILPEYITVPYSQMATIAIRNVATVGGNIVNAASVADSLPLLYALNAELVLICKDSIRKIKVEDFILGKYKVDRKPNEILERILIPKTNLNGYYYKKLGNRKASILSKLSVVILYEKNTENEIIDIRISIGAVNETPIRLKEAEKALLQNKAIDKYIESLTASMESFDDKRSTKNYREQISLDLVKNYLSEIFEGGQHD